MLVAVRGRHRFPLPFFLTKFQNQNENLKNYVKIVVNNPLLVKIINLHVVWVNI
jgi:hypothetical protein